MLLERDPEKVDAREESKEKEKVKVVPKPRLEHEVQKLGMSAPTPGSPFCPAWMGQQGHMPTG